MTDWRARARDLADQLTMAGKLCTVPWREALCMVPRHELVPQFYLQGQGSDRRWRLADTTSLDGREAWLNAVYSDTTLTTAVLPNDHGVLVPVSSSTKPGLMVRMLEALSVHDGQRVLEIGTGTGYNAALLSARLGDHNVFSVDLRPELIDQAHGRLKNIGYQPTLVAGDGALGLAEHAPYDRIIATCSVPAIPPAWIDQLRPGGMILVDVEGPLNAGNLVALRRDGVAPFVQGNFLPWWGRFMPIRRATFDAGYHVARPARTTAGDVDMSWTDVNPAELDEGFRFLAQLHLPAGTFHSLTAQTPAAHPTTTCLVSPDGSWCEVDREPDSHGRYQVRQAGPTRLWAAVEEAWIEWQRLDAPAWHKFGLTATPTEHRIWLRDPTNGPQWTLPTPPA